MASDDKETKKVIVPKTAADVQRFKLQKLLKNPDKPAFIPAKPEEKLPRVFKPPEFVRNIWGSSAGAGSGDFHVYRGVRRREYARQKFLNEKSDKTKLDEEYQKHLKEHKKAAEEKTAKKRTKRLKQKMKQKAKKAKLNNNSTGAKDEENEKSGEESADEHSELFHHNGVSEKEVQRTSAQEDDNSQQIFLSGERNTEDSNASFEFSSDRKSEEERQSHSADNSYDNSKHSCSAEALNNENSNSLSDSHSSNSV